MAVKFDPAAYQQSVNDYLAAMGVNVAPTEQYQTPMAQQQSPMGGMGQTLMSAGLKYGAKKGLSSLLGSSGGAAAVAPEGMTAVGTAANGSTMFAPTSSFLGAQSGTGLQAAAPYIAPAMGAIGAYDLLKNKRHGGRGALQGAASGAAIGSLGGPVGMGIGAALGGTIGYFGNFGDVDQWKKEQGRRQKLAEAGVIGWDKLNAATPQLYKGRSLAELINPNYAKDFQGMTKDAGFVNNKFAASRNEGDLRPEDIWGYSAFGEKFGNDWLGKFSEAQRKGIAQAALDAGAVKEGKGTVNIDFNADLDKRIQEFLKPKAPVTKKK